MGAMEKDTLIRTRDVASMLGVSVTTVYRLVKEDMQFPRPISLGPSFKRKVWSKNDIYKWISKIKYVSAVNALKG
ncbi:MAG: AlpA family phage regulatory protein [Deltaproteobacteria bacterium]|jgi:predicted DNA-binding transcriptional regulator AlpA|nr:AlpA family phage regulatory protein [Deltaproteobacteria bacterium]